MRGQWCCCGRCSCPTPRPCKASILVQELGQHRPWSPSPRFRSLPCGRAAAVPALGTLLGLRLSFLTSSPTPAQMASNHLFLHWVKEQKVQEKHASCTRKYLKNDSLESQTTVKCRYHHYTHFPEVGTETGNFSRVAQLRSSQTEFGSGWFLQSYSSYTTI